MPSLSSQQMQPYILAAKIREQHRLIAIESRRQRALQAAQQAGTLLKIEFGVEQVILFGSLLNETFHDASDIDLAVVGLSEKEYFAAVGCLLALSEFQFDLVEVARASSEIANAIAKGIIL